MSVVLRNNVVTFGRGARPIVFAHGFGCDLNAWNDVAPAFAETNRVVLFDHVGSGGSDLSAYDPVKYGELAGYAGDVLEILTELDLQDAVFVGHSVAATIGMLAAIREPRRFASLVMVCPSPCYINHEDYEGGFTHDDVHGLLEVLDSNFLGWASQMAPAIMGNPERPALGATLANSFCRTDPDIARQFARVTFLSDHRADLPKLKTPSLILQTSADMIAPLSVGQYMHSHVSGSELMIMQATGHCPHMSAPDETIGAIRRFLGPNDG